MTRLIAVLSTLRPSLEKELASRGCEVIVLAPSAISPERIEQGYETVPIDSWDDYAALGDVAERLERRGVTDIWTTDERCLRAAAFLRALLGIAGLSFEDAIAFTDKSAMKQRLADHDIPVAEWAVVRSVAEVPLVAERLGWPIVVKPRSGFSAINTFVVRNSEHFEELEASGAFTRSPDIGVQLPALSATSGLGSLVDSPRGFMVEACIDVVAEYHCEFLVSAGDEVYCLPFRYPTPMLQDGLQTVGSAHVPLESNEAREVQGLTRAAARVLGLRNGFAHAEVFLASDGRWLLGEIGARPGGAQVPKVMAHQYGLDVGRLAGDLVIGTRPQPKIHQGDRSIAWVSIPAPTGIVTFLTPVDELRSLPGVIDVVMEFAVGDVAAGPLGSLAYAGYVFCAADTTDNAFALAFQAAASCRVESALTGERIDA